MPLKWSDPSPPVEGVSCYDHVYADTPLGRVFIEWKGWKYYDTYVSVFTWTGFKPDAFIYENSLEEAKREVQKEWDSLFNRMKEFAGESAMDKHSPSGVSILRSTEDDRIGWESEEIEKGIKNLINLMGMRDTYFEAVEEANKHGIGYVQVKPDGSSVLINRDDIIPSSETDT